VPSKAKPEHKWHKPALYSWERPASQELQLWLDLAPRDSTEFHCRFAAGIKGAFEEVPFEPEILSPLVFEKGIGAGCTPVFASFVEPFAAAFVGFIEEPSAEEAPIGKLTIRNKVEEHNFKADFCFKIVDNFFRHSLRY